MRYKKLTKEQIIISLDRLTRFKNTREKYLRVFSDILISNLIEPKLKKQDIENLDFALITSYVTEIFNGSLDNLYEDVCINNFIKDYENSVFINDIETQKLLDNKINYFSAIKLISNDFPINLKWLKEITELFVSERGLISFHEKKRLITDFRSHKFLKYPIELVILVEGITEEILLPAFARYLNYDFYSKGVQIIPAGGKNQVVKMYYKLASELKLPLFVLLDKDAESNIKQIKPKLRKQDKIHLVSCGEFEDLLPKSLILKTVNEHFKNFLTISESDINSGLPMAKLLEELFKTRGLHEFKKAEFAKLVRDKITCDSDISEEIKAIIAEISFYK